MYISTSYVIRANHAAVLRGWACDHRVVVCMYVCMYVYMCIPDYGMRTTHTEVLRIVRMLRSSRPLRVCCDNRVLCDSCTDVVRIVCMLRSSFSVRIWCDHRVIVLPIYIRARSPYRSFTCQRLRPSIPAWREACLSRSSWLAARTYGTQLSC